MPSCLRRETPSALIRPVRGQLTAALCQPRMLLSRAGVVGGARRLLMCPVASAPGRPGGQRPIMGDSVTGAEATTGAGGAGGE